MRLGRLVGALSEVFLPSLCPFCGEVLPGGDPGMCPDCWSRVLPLAGTCCPRCGLPADSADEECLECQSSPPPFAAAVIWGEHSGILRRAVVAMKHGGRDELVAALGQRLAARIATEPWAGDLDLVTAVPSHPVHRLRRGWAVAELLAREVGSSLVLRTATLLRRHGLRRQARMTRAQRLRMPASSLSARRSVRGRTILVVDDVTTTGMTLRRAATALLARGVRSVYCAVLAHAPDSRRRP